MPQDKEYNVHLTSMSNLLSILKVIKDKLGNGEDQFANSVFRQFTSVKSVVFCCEFIHHMLLCQLECNDTNVMEFEFKVVGARFDRKTFAMVT